MISISFMTTERGLRRKTLKEATEEKDENGEPCINEDNIYGILFNLAGAGVLLFFIPL